MKSIHTITIAILPKGAPKYATTKRTFAFASLEERDAFKAALDPAEVEVCGFNLDHVMTVRDAQREIEREKKLIRRVVGA